MLTRRATLIGGLFVSSSAVAQSFRVGRIGYGAGFQLAGIGPSAPLTVISSNRSNILTLASDNLTLTGNDTNNTWTAAATTNTRAVAVYFEVTIMSASSGSNYHGVLLGVVAPGTTMPNAALPTGFQGDGSYAATGHVGVTLGCYITPASADGTNNGTVVTTYGGATGTTTNHSFKTFQPVTGLYSADTIKCNFGQTAFKYSPPSGAVPA